LIKKKDPLTKDIKEKYRKISTLKEEFSDLTRTTRDLKGKKVDEVVIDEKVEKRKHDLNDILSELMKYNYKGGLMYLKEL